MEFPLAYHITFGTYGTRLHGDPRGTVERHFNQYGTPIVENDPWKQKFERDSMIAAPVVLTDSQRQFIESTMPSICQRGGWEYHICATQPDHVHVLLSSDRPGRDIRKWLKTWLGQELTARWPDESRPRWWAVGGSVKYVWKKPYLRTAYGYIERQRATKG